MAQHGFYYDMTVCTGCKTCQIACKDVNNLEVGTFFRKVYSFEGGEFPKPWAFKLSIACNHCANPKCVENCPTGAMYKRPEDGVVIHRPEKCVGCRMCLWSCPYGAPQYIEKTGKAGKCDARAKLTAQGENPACVDACQMRALQFGDIKELRKKYGELRKKYGEIADAKCLPSSTTTSPSLVVTPTVHAKR
jgi:anaerobic dimethyl sulfoxide reductase subunit B